MKTEDKKTKDLTWKYFWEQKWEEVCGVFFSLAILSGVAGLSIFILSFVEKSPTWFRGVGGIITAFWIIYGIYYWIKSNWEKAKNRAEIENFYSNNPKNRDMLIALFK